MIVDKAVYRQGRRFECGDPSDELDRLRLSDAPGFLWIGLKDPTTEEFAEYDEELQLHPLAVEDALKGNQRAKIDLYENSTFVVLKTLRYIEETSDVETGELMMFLGDRFVLTVRYGAANPLAGVRRRLEENPRLLALGPMTVMHAIMDLVVDTYRAIDVELGQDLESIEEAVFAGDRGVAGPDIYKLKREVLEFKRGAVPLVAPLRRMLTESKTLIPHKQLRPFFVDVLDHLLQVCDHAESYDRLLSDILAAHLAQQGLRQNEDMRRISAWVAIAAVPTMIAGIYGMNFDHMPELHTEYGYFVVLGVMVAACVGLYITFRRADWL
ncbi:Cobalt/magnesium transport protein CorA [Austwickia sp. TVS 96-490-7B]|uniref:magnesium/cobalt transporter CorA n=1 Tax=Austwickia sp. TVS 96-490-7B TaxID=2830843 RepID=UPI001C582651|nr:magnesium/cobalt transporter CorA [Austwickia sp. TVS 96-490-7B]MBW3086250.1 Cobalt/magnesium transport protein CorA [Austwickia sp. TVS 96-490-7B]